MKKYYMLIWIAIIVELALLLIVGIFFKVDNMTVAKGSRYDFNDGWVLCYENGKEKEISELPYVEPCAANETVIMKNIIPQEYKGMTLTFLSADKELSLMAKLFTNLENMIRGCLDIPRAVLLIL